MGSPPKPTFDMVHLAHHSKQFTTYWSYCTPSHVYSRTIQTPFTGLVVKASPPPPPPHPHPTSSRVADLGLNPAFSVGIFLHRVIPLPVTKIGTPVVPGITGSALGLAGSVSVYCGWMRWKVLSTASISVWQHVQLSEQIHP